MATRGNRREAQEKPSLLYSQVLKARDITYTGPYGEDDRMMRGQKEEFQATAFTGVATEKVWHSRVNNLGLASLNKFQKALGIV